MQCIKRDNLFLSWHLISFLSQSFSLLVAMSLKFPYHITSYKMTCKPPSPQFYRQKYLVVISKVCDDQDEYRQKVSTPPTYIKIYWDLIKFHPSSITFAGKAIRIIYNDMKYCSNDQTDNEWPCLMLSFPRWFSFCYPPNRLFWNHPSIIMTFVIGRVPLDCPCGHI